ncbi:DUF4837 family protein [Ancylomarina longa]|uniref:DUF4837 family protein n=1 Tax=Ancylomarina longa TaxID=2487017 RepID=A0A434AGA1_9BACT|nr:DUF4837 family protein [Ancylomarina longa]RUT73347.1 DUF4837 family protein [Ancylomarina longa]
MKKIVQIISLCALIAISTLSCKKTTKGLRPVVTGKSGEVLVLVNDALWDGAVGDTLKSILHETQLGMPQDEPVLDILHITHNAFGRMFKTHRSILDLRISSKISEDKISVKDDMYAKTQAFMRVEAGSKQGMIKLLDENRNKIVGYFLLGERKRKIKVFKKNVVQEIYEKLKKDFDFTLSFPAGYVINKEADNFVWISNETPTTSQGMFIYSYDYKSENAFTKEEVIKKRNFLLKANVPGPKAGSYMSTEKGFPISFRQFEFQGNYAFETRGLWKVENDFMGGPFVSISFLDKESNRVICMDSYVYYPNNKKRELLRELEAIMYSYEKVK